MPRESFAENNKKPQDLIDLVNFGHKKSSILRFLNQKKNSWASRKHPQKTRVPKPSCESLHGSKNFRHNNPTQKTTTSWAATARATAMPCLKSALLMTSSFFSTRFSDSRCGCQRPKKHKNTTASFYPMFFGRPILWSKFPIMIWWYKGSQHVYQVGKLETSPGWHLEPEKTWASQQNPNVGGHHSELTGA